MHGLKDLLEFSKPLHVLYVEDDINIRDNYTKLFSEFFASLDCADDGKEGLEKFKTKTYDIIITDINMPRMNGIEMIQNILATNPEQNIIVTSAHDESHYLLELIDLGIESFLIKPIDFSKMTFILKRCCKRIFETRELKEYQENIEEDNLRCSSINIQLQKKNKELERAIHQLTREENVTITLVDGIEKEKEFSEDELDYYAHNMDTESARDFILAFTGDIENLNDKLEGIEETLELLIHQELNNPTQKSAEKISLAFHDYSVNLANVYKFNNLSEALHNFSVVLTQPQDLDLLKEMKEFLFGIADALQKWRQEVLVKQTAEDIHFLDNSIISDCVQTESMLLGGHDEEDLDDMFF